MTYTWPFPDGTRISQPFGSNPSNGFNPPGGHTGTDFAVPVGTPVRCIGAGIVRGVGQLPEPYTSNPWWIEGQWAGNVVIIDHGPIVSVYAHLSEWDVNLGDSVTQGQVIGLSGATGGASTGPHCHFETIPDGWDFNNGTYGRVEPSTFCTAYWDETTINPQGTPTVKDWLDMATKDEVKAALDELLDEKRPDAEGTPTSIRDLVYISRAMVHDIPNQQGKREVPRQGKDVKGMTSLDGVVANFDQSRIDTIAAMSAAEIANAVPANLAQQVIDALGAKLAAK